ncbi:hypothetical protein EMIHUDRAFT_203993 [Emiliania huxleyi CCMP1516]|uniref:G-protein coupled receptors family 1 profile domain-containing protein n=2 Tax=Emiliania huxleyi TaxID=2903 RepID=A0A0D3K0S3_EMIH1|nr:hypothetical protein EMIHUDRAFT_203993 [Emiliania huxleyi CCMP1516]EOD29358.1 hypothetical protein EMIHUDRAFT_203993 [Emiliania huxleyi CCMP1516]|eukprot:XP_005781787.1 hypothetical protein EMIHUDRAFT_203993 [Emiliania huxleyi CCMP1516]
MATHLAPTIWALVLIVALLSALRVHLAADHRVSRLVGTTVWLSWVLSAVSMLILPIDLARQPPHVQGVERLSCDSQPFSALSVAWSLLLWSTLALGFAMVELLREYELTGGCLASGLYATGQLRSEALVGWLLAACNAWSAFFLMLCLAYCLVQLPRHLWRLSTPPAFVLHLQQLRARRQRERRGAAQARVVRVAACCLERREEAADGAGGAGRERECARGVRGEMLRVD